MKIQWTAGIQGDPDRSQRGEMSRCFYCGAETSLYMDWTPVCVACNELIKAGRPPKKPASEDTDPDEKKPPPRLM